MNCEKLCLPKICSHYRIDNLVIKDFKIKTILYFIAVDIIDDDQTLEENDKDSDDFSTSSFASCNEEQLDSDDSSDHSNGPENVNENGDDNARVEEEEAPDLGLY